MDAQLLIAQKGMTYQPQILDGATFTTQRRSTPSKFECKILKSNNFTPVEGAQIQFKWKGGNVFNGHVFTISYDSGDEVSITAYDQLRYLKNKDTYIYKNKTASQLIKMIADDFNLSCGSIEDSAYNMSRVEDNKSLFDIIETALDETLRVQKKLYVFYDDFGKLTLKSLENMKIVDALLCENNAQDYQYSTTIDKDTYNKIKLYYDNGETGKRDLYITQDSDSMARWGTLQYYEKLSEGENGKTKADALLKLYNAPTRTLSVENVTGDVRVRAGSLVLTKLDDLKISNYMLVEQATHTFENSLHTMSLTLAGGALDG